MSYQPLTEPENVTQQMAQQRSSAIPARSFQAESHLATLQLQRVLGNQSVAGLIQTRRLRPGNRIMGFQRKLTADDQYEREADHVARQVVSMPDPVPQNSMPNVKVGTEEVEAENVGPAPIGTEDVEPQGSGAAGQGCRITIPYVNPKAVPFAKEGECGAAFASSFDRVIAKGAGCPKKLGGLILSEKVSTDGGCSSAGSVSTGTATVGPDGDLTGSGDVYGFKFSARRAPSCFENACTETYSQDLFIGENAVGGPKPVMPAGSHRIAFNVCGDRMSDQCFCTTTVDWDGIRLGEVTSQTKC